MAKVNLTKEQKAKANPFMLNNHYIGFDDWINQSFEMILDEDDKPIKVRGALQCFDEHSNPVYNDRYKLKRKNELWLILITYLIRLALQQQNKSVTQNREIEPYIYYGTYASLRDDLAKHYPKELKNQLKQSINLSTISTSMKRAAESGFIKIEYDHEVNSDNKRVMNAQGRHYRSIKLNYDKILELSSFNLDPKHEQKNDYTWQKYHRCSREHKWIKKRIISSLLPLVEELKDKERKAEFKKKLAKLNLKLKGPQDVFKAFIITKQGDRFLPNEHVHDNLTALKSTKGYKGAPPPEEEIDYDSSGYALTAEQEAFLEAFYERIV